jgi:nitrate reductase NapE component
VLLLGVAGLFAYQVSELPEQHVQRDRGLAIYPLVIGIAIGVASLLLLVKSLLNALRTGEAASEEEQEKRETKTDEDVTLEDEPQEDKSAEMEKYSLASRVLFPVLGIAILVGYGWALYAAGYLVATPVLLVLLLLAYRVRSWKVIAGLSVGTTVVIYLVFYYLLLVRLP